MDLLWNTTYEIFLSKKKIKPESDQASKFQFIGNNRGSQNPINTSKRMENGTEKSRIRETPQETQ